MTEPLARGVVIGRLRESHSDRIVVGTYTLHLRRGAACSYRLGASLEVGYTEQDGRRHVDTIAPGGE
jgi:hypothetical protein